MFRSVPLSIIKSFSLYTQQWYMSQRFADSCRAGSGWNCSSILILLRKLPTNLYDIHHCCVYGEKLLMMDRGTVRNRQSFIPKINLRNQCIQLVLLREIYHDARSHERQINPIHYETAEGNSSLQWTRHTPYNSDRPHMNSIQNTWACICIWQRVQLDSKRFDLSTPAALDVKIPPFALHDQLRLVVGFILLPTLPQTAPAYLLDLQ